MTKGTTAPRKRRRSEDLEGKERRRRRFRKGEKERVELALKHGMPPEIAAQVTGIEEYLIRSHIGRKRGRPSIELSTEDILKIEMMAGFGLTAEAIAMVMGFSRATLFNLTEDERVAEALGKGRALAEMKVSKSLYDKAVKDGNIQAIIWYEKTRCGRSDRIDLQVDAKVEAGINYFLDFAEQILEPSQFEYLVTEFAASQSRAEAAATN